MNAHRFSSIFIFMILFSVSASHAQVDKTRSTYRHVHADSSKVSMISVAELEMILPEKRLRPEVETPQLRAGEYIESPLSSASTAPRKAASSKPGRETQVITNPNAPPLDPLGLEKMSTGDDQASGAPSK